MQVCRRRLTQPGSMTMTNNYASGPNSDYLSQGSVIRPREALTFRDLELNITSHRVLRNGHSIHLTPTAFRLLHHLMKDPFRVYSRPELKNAAWPDNVHIGLRTVDVHIGHLRAALNRVDEPVLIRTVRSLGYALFE
ncbi:winged helix-turn-helix domain-containing protein [Rhizobium favelukesii]|uniref:winged helix-turn-helix domain-containing protein n=2 Tax=Rhizobium/Agrobacterium group TaxID=227290 RepID=UPI0009EC1F16|nr:winged helix-turn-helix domain-containing protein [Rhizobium favelukesii]